MNIIRGIALNPLHVPQWCSLQVEDECTITGISDIPGCGCGLHPGGVAAAGMCSEEAVLGCDAGEL